MLRLHPRPRTRAKRGRRSRQAHVGAPFPAVVLSGRPAARKERVVCVGQPSRPRGERLEVTTGKVVVACCGDDPLAEQSELGRPAGAMALRCRGVRLPQAKGQRERDGWRGDRSKAEAEFPWYGSLRA